MFTKLLNVYICAIVNIFSSHWKFDLNLIRRDNSHVFSNYLRRLESWSDFRVRITSVAFLTLPSFALAMFSQGPKMQRIKSQVIPHGPYIQRERNMIQNPERITVQSEIVGTEMVDAMKSKNAGRRNNFAISDRLCDHRHFHLQKIFTFRFVFVRNIA